MWAVLLTRCSLCFGLCRSQVSEFAGLKRVVLKGDLPIGVDKRSVDTWMEVCPAVAHGILRASFVSAEAAGQVCAYDMRHVHTRHRCGWRGGDENADGMCETLGPDFWCDCCSC
jgi:hypothetical protein